MSVITNSAHDPGRTCLVYSVDGSVAYTGGSDCLVRIWDTSIGTDQEPNIATHAEDAITSISSADGCWCSGSIDSYVRCYVKGKPEMLGQEEVGPEIPVECVAIDPRGKRVAVASRELAVKLFNLDDMSKVSLLEGHTKRVRRITWHPSEPLLTTCGSDGRVVVWDVSEENPKLFQTIDGIIPTTEDTEPEFSYDCSVVWHPSGQHFYLASKNNEIVNITRESWSKSFAISDESVSSAITALALSANGVYLASASNSEVIIWSTQTRRLLFRQSGSKDATITQLAFSPSQNVLSWTDDQGLFSRWQQPIPDTLPSPIKVTSTGTSTVAMKKRSEDLSLFPDDGGLTGLEDITVENLDDDWIIDDTGDQMMDDDTGNNGRKKELIKEMVSITKAQPPFQPGSTPMEHKKRYLAYNMIGVIDVTDQDSHHIVNVEFHDQSARKGYYFTDHFKYDMGYLGERGAVFACPPENEHPAQVLYKPYGTWTSSSDWTYKMRPGARVIGIAAGGVVAPKSHRQASDDLNGFGNVVIATSEGDLTFLSGTGRERRIMGLGAEYVSMAAGPEWVFVVHRAGSTTIDGSQNLSYSLFNFDDFSVRQTGVLPITKGHLLEWIGVTEEGAPAIYDTAGWVHVLTKFRIPLGASWARILDTNLLERREGKDESYWPIGITGSTFMCLILKGRQEYPHFPKPLIQELPIRLPFRRDPDEMALEESIERETLLLEMKRDELGDELITDDIAKWEMAMDKEFIRLIQQACKKDNIPRAIEVCKLLHHTVSFDMAIKVANFYQLMGLREKMEILKADREEDDRLVIARDKRRQWTKSDRPPRVFSSSGDNRPPSPKPLQDYKKPPTIHRPGLARTTPYVEHTRYSAAAQPENTVDSAPVAFTSSPEGKRKRGNEDDVVIDDSPKRRAVQDVPPIPKPTGNPFIRKSDNKNPFARKVEPNKILQKSESFFEKVDAAESQPMKRNVGSKSKQKEKKEATRQMTLLGHVLGTTTDKKARNKKKAAENGTIENTSIQEESKDVSSLQDTEMSALDITSPSNTDVMVETQEVESQTLSESQTQVETQTQGDQIPQESEPNTEPIDWPPSPPAATVTLPDNTATVEVVN